MAARMIEGASPTLRGPRVPISESDYTQVDTFGHLLDYLNKRSGWPQPG